MNNTKKLAAQVAGALAIATLVGTSAFAETRHLDATERDRSGQSQEHRGSRDGRGQSSDRNNNQSQSSQTQARDRTDNRRESRGSTPQTYERHGTRNNGAFNGGSQADTFRNHGFDGSQADANRNRSNDRSQVDANRNRNYDRSQADSYRNRGNDRNQADSYRNRGNDRSNHGYHNNRPEYDDHGRRSMSMQGRVNRFEHERGGYRVWIAGGRYPVWIPEARISLFPRLRIGLSLNFGGYYDPRGYLDAYDYYDGGYYGGGYYGGNYGGSGYSSGILRGVVETLDYRRGTLVLRDENSGAFVTTLIRDARLETLRPGDYAEISGDWTRAGVFEGLRLEDVQGGRY